MLYELKPKLFQKSGKVKSVKRRRQRRRGRESDSSDLSDVSDLSEGRQGKQDRKIDRISVKPFIYQIKFRKGYTNQNSE